MYHYTTVTISQSCDVILLFIVIHDCLLSSLCEGDYGKSNGYVVVLLWKQYWLGDCVTMETVLAR